MRRGERESGHEVAASDRVGELDDQVVIEPLVKTRQGPCQTMQPSAEQRSLRERGLHRSHSCKHTVVTVRMAANAADAANLVVLLAAIVVVVVVVVVVVARTHAEGVRL